MSRKHRPAGPPRLITIADLIRAGERLLELAYSSTTGDPTAPSVGQHARFDPDKPDVSGLTKRNIYDHALKHDLAWFERHAAAVAEDPFSWPPSLRSLVPKDPDKPEGDKRPIDDPAEVKRLVVLHVRDIISPRLVNRITEGQFGGRRAKDAPVYCKRKGATHLDQVATAIWQAIRGGYPWCVLIDLKDAFGRVPEDLLRRELKVMRLADEAVQFVWRLARLDAVQNRANKDDPAKRITRKGMGIEQGNALSADLMNLVLAPVLRRVEARLPVRGYSYLDDIYLMARTEGDAYTAFRRFKAIAEGLGFDNVRPLWKPGRPKGKLSQVVNSAVDPLLVLKTNEVDALGISLAAAKSKQVRQVLKGDFAPMTINQVRKAAGSQALTLQAMRRRTNLMRPRLPFGGGVTSNRSPSGSDPAPSPSPAGGVGSPREPSRSTRLLRETGTDDEPVPPRREMGMGPVSPSSERETNPVENSTTPPQVAGCFFSGSPDLDDRVQGDVQEAHQLPVLPVDLDDGVSPLGEVPDSRGLRSYLGDLVLGSSSPSGDGIPGALSSLVEGGRSASSRCNQASSASRGLCGGSCSAEVPDRHRSRGQAAGDRRPVHLLLSHPEIQAALVAGRAAKFGASQKGNVLDLTGLGNLDLPEHLLAEVINGLIRAVRERGRAEVIIDPVERWTTRTDILGGRDDRTYRLDERKPLRDGRRLLALRHKTRQQPRRRRVLLPGGLDGVVSIRLEDRAAHIYRLDVVEDGKRVTRRIDVDSPCPAGGAALAVADWVQSRGDREIALPCTGLLAALADVLAAGKCVSPNIAFGDGARALMATRVWDRGAGWVVGRCAGTARPGGSTRRRR